MAIHACGRAALLLCLALFASWSAQAIVIRHDRPDSRYVVDADRYPQLFYLQTRHERKVCLATLISLQWAITAGHCVEDTPVRRTLAANADYAVRVGGAEYAITRLELHPDYHNGDYLHGVDLALIRLDRPVAGVEPVALNRELDERDRVITLFGWGYTGRGDNGRRHNDGQLRRAENLVEEADLWLRFNFDDPRLPGSRALSLEGVPGLGDSGGPALFDTGNGPLLLGVAIGEVEEEGAGARQGVYGATQIYERISRHIHWIDAVTGAR